MNNSWTFALLGAIVGPVILWRLGWNGLIGALIGFFWGGVTVYFGMLAARGGK